MILKPKYPKKILENPYYSGMISGLLIAIGFSLIIFLKNKLGFVYGIIIFGLGVYHYIKKDKEFNEN